MSSTAWWYLARSSGIVAWLFLVATVVIGALAAGRMVERKGATRWLSDLHPWLAALSVLLVVLHIAAIIADHTISFRMIDAVVPFAAHWRPLAISWGVLGVWLLAAIMLTSLARRWMSRTVWHAVHLASYGLAATVTVHAITAGTDFTNPLVARAVGGITAAALAVSLLRAMEARKPAPAARRVPAVARVPASRAPSRTAR